MTDRYLIGLACSLIADQLGDSDFEHAIAETADENLELAKQSYEDTMESVHLIIGNIVQKLRMAADNPRRVAMVIELLKEND